MAWTPRHGTGFYSVCLFACFLFCFLALGWRWFIDDTTVQGLRLNLGPVIHVRYGFWSDATSSVYSEDYDI